MSEDTKHHGIFVDHVLRDLIVHYNIENEDLWVQSDNASSQYKNKYSLGLLQLLADEFTLRKRALRFLCNDYEISYEELLSKSSTSSMNVKRLRALCVELYKTINKLNPDFMRDLFKLRFTNRPVREKYKMNMIIPEFNQVSYGKKSLRTFGPKLWNSLPYHIKSSENLESFKRTIKHWNGERCLCKVCNCS